MPLQKSYSERVGLSKVSYELTTLRTFTLPSMMLANDEDRTGVPGSDPTAILLIYKHKDHDLYRPFPMLPRQS